MAWPRVCRPPDLGGLGIIDLDRFGFALRLRWLWLRKTDSSRPWLHLNDDREPLVEAMFQASVYVELGDGTTALFWSDRWLQGSSFQDLAPCLCNAVSARVRAQRTVAQALSNRQWIKDITRALTVQVLVEYLQTWDRMQLIQLSANQIECAGSGQLIGASLRLRPISPFSLASTQSKVQNSHPTQMQVLHLACLPRSLLDSTSS